MAHYLGTIWKLQSASFLLANRNCALVLEETAHAKQEREISKALGTRRYQMLDVRSELSALIANAKIIEFRLVGAFAAV
jgi:hypothetical protein